MNSRRAPRCTRAYDPRLREAVGAYLLGGLEPPEADEVSSHLSECESCRAEYAELSDLVPLMALVTEHEAVRGPVRPEPGVLDRVIVSSRQQSAQSVRAEPRPPRARPRRTRLALAAACVVLAAGASAIGMRMSTHPTVSTSWSASAIVVNPYLGPGDNEDITALAKVTPSHSGSKIDFTMTGVPRNYTCRMLVKNFDGQKEWAGTWSATNGGSVAFPADSPYSPDRISGIDIMLPDGTDLMHISHP